MTAGGTGLALKADAFVAQLESEEQDGLLPAAEADSHRLRLTLEGSRDVALGNGAGLTGTAEVGARLDGGDAETGAGAEVGGSLAYAHPELGLNMEARGRFLLTHRASGFDEWGASLSAAFDPGAPGRGPHVAIAPAWGAVSTGVESMWRDARTVETRQEGGEDRFASADAAMTMTARAGWGLDVLNDRGLLTPFGALDLSGGASQTRLGTSLAASAPHGLEYGIDLYREQAFGNGADNAGGVALDARLARVFARGFGVLELVGSARADDAGDRTWDVGVSAGARF